MFRWRKSSFSDSDAACVELAHLPTRIVVRDSKDPHGPVLNLPQSASGLPSAWLSRLAGEAFSAE